MSKLSKSHSYETAFGIYTVDEQIGEGGSGRVYGGETTEGIPVAVKVLSNASSSKRARFKNEIAFGETVKHPNVVDIIDHGLALNGKDRWPFYVMPRYEGNLRALMKKGIEAAEVMPLYRQILDGVEAAHLKRVVHRDVKPENVLYRGTTLAVADFGIARFTEDILVTLIKTDHRERLANFQYAAPEQRAGQPANEPADIYALGLVLNEMFTGSLALGTEYTKIGSLSKDHAYLDQIVERMLRQRPSDRPQTIQEVKLFIQKYGEEAVSLQRLSAIDQTVINASEIDDPLALEPPKLIDAKWAPGNTLTLLLDRPVSHGWVGAFKGMGNYTCVSGKPPSVFNFNGDKATVGVDGQEAQRVIDFFKAWLPQATRLYRHTLEQQAEQQRLRLQAEREMEKRRLEVNQRLRV